MNISYKNDNGVLRFEVSVSEEYSVIRRELIVRDVIQYSCDDKSNEDYITITYTNDYQDTNEATYVVTYHDSEGVVYTESIDVEINKLFDFVAVDNVRLLELEGELKLEYLLKNYNKDEVPVEAMINNIPIKNTSADLISSTHINFLDLYFNINDTEVHKVELKLLIVDGEIIVFDDYIISKPINRKSIRRYAKVSYVCDGDIYCAYKKDKDLIFKVIKNEEVFQLNDHTISLMFLLTKGSTLSAYKVDFNDLII